MPSYTRVKHVDEATTPTVLITYRSYTFDGKPVISHKEYMTQLAHNIYKLPKEVVDKTTIYSIHEVHK